MSRTRQNYTKALTISEKENNKSKGNVVLNVFIDFAYIRSYDQTKTLAWKRACAIISKLKMIGCSDHSHFGQSLQSSTRHLKKIYESLHCKLFLRSKLFYNFHNIWAKPIKLQFWNVHPLISIHTYNFCYNFNYRRVITKYKYVSSSYNSLLLPVIVCIHHSIILL